MSGPSSIFAILSSLISIYSFICLINIFLTWIPAARYTKFGQFIAAITNPYLNLFRKIRWLQVGNVNFSPILSIGLLSLAGSTFAQISRTGRLFVSGLLISLLQLIWQLIFGIGIIIFLLALIRFIVLIVKKGVTPYDSPWNHVDAILSPLCYKITKPIASITKKIFSYRSALGLSSIIIAVGLTATKLLLGFIAYLCQMIPF
ncbi:MAG: YggT family protein [Treponema sp.]|nr:YggT family protein [Treponema sp.]